MMRHTVCLFVKRCCGCGDDKPLAEYPKASAKFDGRGQRCCVCNAARHQEYYRRKHAVIRADNKRRRDHDRHAALRHYSGGDPHCSCCGETRDEFLTFDHVNGGGAKHRRAIGGGGNFYSWLRRNSYPAGFRVLCFNCNCSTGFLGYCPHEREAAVADADMRGDMGINHIQWAAVASGGVLKLT